MQKAGSGVYRFNIAMATVLFIQVNTAVMTKQNKLCLTILTARLSVNREKFRSERGAGLSSGTAMSSRLVYPAAFSNPWNQPVFT